jgi:uncharacterized protein YkwD
VTVVSRISAAGVLLLAILAVVVLLPGRAEAAQCKGGDASPAKLSGKRQATAVFCLINKERRSHGIRPLKRQHEQTKAARKHNRLMIRKGCFSHQCPGESDLTGRLTKANYLPCNCSWGIAENIAYGSGRRGSPRNIVEAWMHSSEHRANILNSSFRHIGIAAGDGTPSSARSRNGATYTTDFGYRR